MSGISGWVVVFKGCVGFVREIVACVERMVHILNESVFKVLSG